MKAVKIILSTLVAIVVLLFIVSIFLPKKIEVERTMVIDEPIEVLFNQVNDLRNWNEWSPWHKIDPEWEVDFYGEPIGEGQGYEWESDHPSVGNGNIKIVYSNSFDSIATIMDFMEQGEAIGYYTFEETPEGVNVTMGMIAENEGLIDKYKGLFMDNMVGKSYEQALTNLDESADKLGVYLPTYEKKELRRYIGIEATSTQDKISLLMNEHFAKLMKFIAMNNELNVGGSPFTIYRDFKDNGDIMFESGVLVEGESYETDDINFNVIPEGYYVSVNHFGSYDKLEVPHNFIQNWIRNHELTISGYPMEFYITDPQDVNDPNDILTIISYRVDK